MRRRPRRRRVSRSTTCSPIFRELVEVESPSLDVDALAASAKVLAAVVERRLGGTASLVDGPSGRTCAGSAAASRRSSCSATTTRIPTARWRGTRCARSSTSRATGPRRVRHARRRIVQALHGLALDFPRRCRDPVQRRRGGRINEITLAHRGTGSGLWSVLSARTVGRQQAAQDRPEGHRDVRGDGPRARPRMPASTRRRV